MARGSGPSESFMMLHVSTATLFSYHSFTDGQDCLPDIQSLVGRATPPEHRPREYVRTLIESSLGEHRDGGTLRTSRSRW